MNTGSIIQIVVDQEYVKNVAKEQIQQILNESGFGCWWDMKRLEAETCRKRDWLLENIILNPRYREEMNFIGNGCEGGRWMFRAAEMRQFLSKHFDNLNKRTSQRMGSSSND